MNLFHALFLLLIAFGASHVNAQVIDLGKCDSNQLDQNGFTQLKEIIGDARMLVIGEQEHGVGTDYENFAFMVKYLHEEMGFNVIIQEYCFYTFGDINSKLSIEGSAQNYRKGMYWPQAKALENDILFDYLDEERKGSNPIYMDGFDPRIFLRKDYYNFCDSLLNENQDLLNMQDMHVYLETLDNLLRYEYGDTLTPELNKQSFLKQTDSLIQKLKDPRTIQQFKSLKGFAKNAWNFEGRELTDLDRFHEREKQMAENIFWLAETVYPNEKIILRMHNGHAAKNLDELKGYLPDSLIKEKLNVGSRLQERYGKSCIHIGSTYYSGTYCKWDYKTKKIPDPHPKSIESKLAKKGYDYAYVPLNEKSKFHMFYNEFNNWIAEGIIKAPFGHCYDGLIFIKNVKPPTEKQQTARPHFEVRTIQYKGIEMEIPSHWSVHYSTFMDTLKNLKTGEFAPGIVTPKTGVFTGQDFLLQITAKEEIDFEETSFSFDGMPFELIKTDAIKLKNVTWYLGLLHYDVNFPYQYAYYGDFKNKGVMINFYTESIEPKNETLHKQILETVRLVN